ncbi:MAG: tetratricopeptide repeat protein [Planctomycetes bacterium]|nr:tetratricopeptide repeat protein [Planctomycetota bacterium]
MHVGESGDLVEEYEAVWTPTVIVATADGTVRHRSVGPLPPNEFMAQLEFGIAKADFDRGNYAEASKVFREVLEQYSTCDCAPEAMYWLGVSEYKRTGSADAMKAEWRKLLLEYPDSPWAKKVSFIEDK